MPDKSIVDENVIYSIVEKAKKYDELARPFRDKRIHCSFCGKSQSEVERIIAGQRACICNECVEVCNEVLADTDKEDKNKEE